MTRNEIELIARCMKESKPSEEHALAAHSQFVRDCNKLASMLAGTNARFDMLRFLKACGL